MASDATQTAPTTPPSNGLTRRSVLQKGAVAAGMLGAAPLLEACGSSSSSPSANTTPSSGIRRGGTLTVGDIGNGTSETLKVDGEGRVILSDTLKSHAGITEAIAFVGLGHKFQIWEPGRFRAQLAEATGTVRAAKKQLGSWVAAHDAQKARE